MQAYTIAHMIASPGMRKLVPGALLVLGITLGPIGCSTSNHGSASPAHTEHASQTSLELNDGKKWVVAKPMMAHIRNLENAVRDFDRTLGREHAVLATEIQENLGRLVTNCTMEGKAHDELHKWLLPFVGLSGEYAHATDPQVQQQTLKEIQQALLVFNEYFE